MTTSPAEPWRPPPLVQHMMDLAEWERGGAFEARFGPYDDPKPLHVGPMCRCVPCCCKDGQGHKHPDWIAWEDRQDGRGGGARPE